MSRLGQYVQHHLQVFVGDYILSSCVYRPWYNVESSNGNCVVDNGSIIMVTATTGNNGGCNVIKPMPEPPSPIGFC